jgi:glycosyltransferase involved in cell wall biosynthesis
MSHPLVTVICLCYNHARFVAEAVESVMQQTWPNVELLLVDDASTDKSREVIKTLAEKYPNIQAVYNACNMGHCRSFNAALRQSKGLYVIDLAADDVLMPDRIQHGVEELERGGANYGVHFGDALYIDETGSELGRHADKYPHHLVPEGHIYKELIRRYFICPPTLMFRRSVLERLGGYDESLHYEDFDVLVRAARHFYFRYSPKVLLKRRITKGARSAAQFRLLSRHSLTTLAVCRKIMQMNRTEEERRALQERLRYELGLNLRLLNVDVVWRLVQLYCRNLITKYD